LAKISPNFNLKNYDFGLCKGFFMKRKTQICQILRKFSSPLKFPDFDDKFQ